MHIGLPAPEVASLHRVVEQAVYRVTVIVIVLGGVDSALGRDGVGAARRIVERENLDFVAEFAEGGGGRGTGQSTAHHDDLELPLVARVDQAKRELVVLPLVGDGTVGNLGV